jgi:predicted nucleotidyltransferase
MRLSDQQVQIIRALVREGLGSEARVCVFGSRVDETATGGDIDLLIELPEKAALAREIALAARLEQQLGRPVDVLTTWPGQRERPIVEIARLTGVPL